MTIRIDGPLQPLVLRLRARYPEICILEARVIKWTDGFLQQMIRCRAPLERLRQCGLVSEEMLRCRSMLSACGETSMGEAFHLIQCSGRGEGACWDLDLCTESAPREPDQLDVSEARGTLANLFARENLSK